eukprot:3896434-Ditylum_brightwellii.AAC.1
MDVPDDEYIGNIEEETRADFYVTESDITNKSMVTIQNGSNRKYYRLIQADKYNKLTDLTRDHSNDASISVTPPILGTNASRTIVQSKRTVCPKGLAEQRFAANRRKYQQQEQLHMNKFLTTQDDPNMPAILVPTTRQPKQCSFCQGAYQTQHKHNIKTPCPLLHSYGTRMQKLKMNDLKHMNMHNIHPKCWICNNHTFHHFDEIIMCVSAIGETGHITKFYKEVFICGKDFDTIISNIDKAEHCFLVDSIKDTSSGSEYLEHTHNSRSRPDREISIMGHAQTRSSNNQMQYGNNNSSRQNAFAFNPFPQSLTSQHQHYTQRHNNMMQGILSQQYMPSQQYTPSHTEQIQLQMSMTGLFHSPMTQEPEGDRDKDNNDTYSCSGVNLWITKK